MQSKKESRTDVCQPADGDSADGDSEGGNDGEQVKPRKLKVECIIGNKTEEELRELHPQRNTFEFPVYGATVTVTSDFDAGNMARCEQMESGNHVSTARLRQAF